MKVNVRYAAQARDAAGLSAEAVELGNPATVAALLARVAELHGEVMRALVLRADGAPQPALLVFVGDEQVRPGEARGLMAGDTVLLMSPISGG